MREADRRAIEDIGIPSMVLMENAGRQVVATLDSTFEDLRGMRVAVLCGRGNNGGDGFVVARTLIERSIDVGVYLVGQGTDVKGDARLNLEILSNLGVDVVEIRDAAAWELHGTDVLGSDLIVDALFGTGLNAPLSGLTETIVEDLNSGRETDRRDRSAERTVGGRPGCDRPRPARHDDGDARRAEAAAGAAAGGSIRRQPGDRGYRHSAGRDRSG